MPPYRTITSNEEPRIKTTIKVSENPSVWGENQQGTTHVQTASDR